jgi:DNA-binding response OmpR family regulator
MPVTIISIEDETEMAEFLGVALTGPDIQIVSSGTALDGLELVRELHPALVLIDIVLPDMDGWSVYDAIRTDPELVGTPVIMVTGLRREFQPRRLFRSTARDAYLTKPFDTAQLRSLIEQMLGVHIW